MFQDKYADLCDQLSAADIVSELFSAGCITSYMMDEVDAANTKLEKNKRLLRCLEVRRYPVADLCKVLDKFEPFKYLAENLRAGQPRVTCIV